VPIRHADDVTTLDQGSVPPRRRCSSPWGPSGARRKELIAVLEDDAEDDLSPLRIAQVLHGEGRDDEALEWIEHGLEADGPAPARTSPGGGTVRSLSSRTPPSGRVRRGRQAHPPAEGAQPSPARPAGRVHAGGAAGGV